MAVRIRLKKMGRRHRPFYRVCAMDVRAPRDGKVIEELGYYDPMVRETDARTVLNADRIDYWLGVGAQPTEKVRVLIKKYGTSGTHLEQQKAALERLAVSKPSPPPAQPIRREEPPAEASEAKSEDAPAEEPASPPSETPSSETPSSETPSSEAASSETPPEKAAQAVETTSGEQDKESSG